MADPVTIKLKGHLTAQQMTAALAQLSVELENRREPTALLVDASTMTGYDAEARHEFIEWNRQHKGRIARVAIVTDNLGWRIVITAMSLASSQQMSAFSTTVLALDWCKQPRTGR